MSRARTIFDNGFLRAEVVCVRPEVNCLNLILSKSTGERIYATLTPEEVRELSDTMRGLVAQETLDLV